MCLRMSMTPAGGHSGGLIFQQPVLGNRINVLRSVHKESLIFTALSDLCVCNVWNAEQQPPHCPGSALSMRKAAQRCVWSDSLNLSLLSSSAMTSSAPPERVMNGTTESHNDHILNCRWQGGESLAFSSVSYIQSPGLYSRCATGEQK